MDDNTPPDLDETDSSLAKRSWLYGGIAFVAWLLFVYGEGNTRLWLASGMIASFASATNEIVRQLRRVELSLRR